MPSSANPSTAYGTEQGSKKNFVEETKFSGELWLNPEIGNMYSRVERITGPFATPLLHQAGLYTISKPTKVLDLCCGTGVVFAHLQQIAEGEGSLAKLDLTCGDFSQSQLAHVSNRIEKNRWDNAKAVLVNAMNTGLPTEEFDHVIIAMALMLIPDPIAAVRESFRMLKRGGTFSFSTWFYEAWRKDVAHALSTLPNPPPWPQTSDELIMAWATGPWHLPSYCRDMLLAAGFKDVKIELLSVHMPMRDAEDFCDIYEAFIEMVTDKYWTEEQRNRCRPLIRGAVSRELNKKYGEGRGFTTERVNVMVTAKKPEA